MDPRLVLVDRLDERDSESEGLPGTGLGLPYEVPAVEEGPNGLRLYGEGPAVAGGVHPFPHGGGDAQLVEAVQGPALVTATAKVVASAFGRYIRRG